MSVSKGVPASKGVSVKKLGSKLAQGVRQVMDQQVKPAVENVKESISGATATAATAASVSKPSASRVTAKAQLVERNEVYEILHPERVWPD